MIPLTQVSLSAARIEALVDSERLRAEALFPRWQHPYRGMAFSRARRILGQAHRDGHIKLSTIFIGTQAQDDLTDTVRHELAHLIAGISARHGPRWKQVAAALGAAPSASGRALSEELSRRLDNAPLSLVAVMHNGEEVIMKPAYRRSGQYMAYRYGQGRRNYFYRGQAVQCFRYVPRSQS